MASSVRREAIVELQACMMVWKLKVIELYQTLEVADEWIADALAMTNEGREEEARASLEEAV